MELYCTTLVAPDCCTQGGRADRLYVPSFIAERYLSTHAPPSTTLPSHRRPVSSAVVTEKCAEALSVLSRYPALGSLEVELCFKTARFHACAQPEPRYLQRACCWRSLPVHSTHHTLDIWTSMFYSARFCLDGRQDPNFPCSIRVCFGGNL